VFDSVNPTARPALSIEQFESRIAWRFRMTVDSDVLDLLSSRQSLSRRLFLLVWHQILLQDFLCQRCLCLRVRTLLQIKSFTFNIERQLQH
jgi:hypothetical protein